MATPKPHSDPFLGKELLDDQQAIERIFNHLDKGTTDLGDTAWHETV